MDHNYYKNDQKVYEAEVIESSTIDSNVILKKRTIVIALKGNCVRFIEKTSPLHTIV